MGSETPMHPSRTPLHPYMTPMRDSGASPIHDGMRTPMRDRAWNPYTPMSPPRDNWEEGNPGSWGTSPQYQPGSPPSRAYEAPTPGSGWASTSGGSYSDAGTPRDHGSAYANAPSPYIPSTPGQPMTPSSTSYLPGTPGGQPMTPGTGLDVMSPVIGGDAEAWFMPDILVDIHKVGKDSDLGVIRDVSDGTCKVSLGSSGEGDTIVALPSELEIVPPRKNDRVKIVGGQFRGSIGKLIGIDGSDGIVKIEDNLDVKILDLAILTKFVQP
ncbi:putative transcription elongation factor SPT5 homolog 1 [Brassica napus]|nr:putative transcription elongation factor SPT5 homolog 1 [Brassica napus]